MDLKGIYTADTRRYDDSQALYNRCGKSGILLPKVSLGFWHNFGGNDSYERSRKITHFAFDHGINHFDLANNYGPPYGSAEETMGSLIKDDFRPYRDELFISTKAGYDMWEGPYGNWGSRKYLHHFFHIFKAALAAEILPEAEGHRRQLEPAFSAAVVYHFFVSFFVGCVHIFAPFHSGVYSPFIILKCLRYLLGIATGTSYPIAFRTFGMTRIPSLKNSSMRFSLRVMLL